MSFDQKLISKLSDNSDKNHNLIRSDLKTI
jgi:hypothetical protein